MTPRRKRKRRTRRKRRGKVNEGGSIWSLLKGAAQVGVKLGKSKRYKRMGALGVGDAVSNLDEDRGQYEAVSTSVTVFTVCVKRSQSF